MTLIKLPRNRALGNSPLCGGGTMATHFDEYEKHARLVTMQHHSEFRQFLTDQKSRELSPSERKHLSKLGLDESDSKS
jgi:hypothetical protein